MRDAALRWLHLHCTRHGSLRAGAGLSTIALVFQKRYKALLFSTRACCDHYLRARIAPARIGRRSRNDLLERPTLWRIWPAGLCMTAYSASQLCATRVLRVHKPNSLYSDANRAILAGRAELLRGAPRCKSCSRLHSG